MSVPRHVAIIMDGNARWARARGQPVAFGHKQGAEALKGLLEPCARLGITCLSVYAFSQENWARPQQEVSDLMLLLDWYLKRELETLRARGIRLHISGELADLPEATAAQVRTAMEATQGGEALTLNICLSYGSRQEMVRACRELASRCAAEEMTADTITEEALEAQLYTHSLPPLDLLIRTGGEMRLSNFLLWQSAYAELYFTDTLWPDFDALSLELACSAYSQRERRYGKR